MSVRVFYDILNQKGTPAMYTDTFANRPAYGYQGRLFISTDSGQIFEDTGSAWTLVADAGVGGGTLSSVCLNGNTTATGIVITAGGLSSNSITNTGNTAGSVLFAGTSGLESQSNATFFWDNTNKRLGIGNASPGAPLDIHGTGTQIQVNGTGASNSYIQFQNAGVSKWRIGNTYNGAANTFDLYNNSLTSTALSFNVTTNAATFNNSITATSLIKSGGTSAQILAGDGSVITAGTNITISGGTISSSGGGGSITLSAIGSTPNANAATLTGSALNLEPASASFGGVVTTGTQTFAGAKTFSSSVTTGGQLALNSGFGTSTAAISIYNNTGSSASNVALIDFRVNNSFGGNERVASITASNPNAGANNGGQLTFGVSANGTSTTPTTALTIASTGAATFNSSVTASSFVKSSGTSAQILAGDGSVITAGTNITISGGTISSSGGGSITLSAIGSSPNANAATLTGSALNLEPASASFGGVVTTGTQSFAGAKTFGENVNISKNGNFITSLTISNSTSGTGSGAKMYISSNSTSGGAEFGKQSSTSSAYKNFGPSDFVCYNGVAGNISFLNDYPSGGFNIVTGGIDIKQFIIDSAGSVGFSTNTIGSKVQINGNLAVGYSASTAAPTNGLQVAGIVNTASRLNVNGATDNSLFSLNSGGTLYTVGFSPNATANSTNTLTLTTAQTTWIYNGTGVATWTLFNPSGTNQMIWIKNAGTGIITLNAYSGTNIINNSGTSVTSITIAVGATALIQQDGGTKSYQLQ
jgi:hypothetical protein